jgi:hypothetical protein
MEQIASPKNGTEFDFDFSPERGTDMRFSLTPSGGWGYMHFPLTVRYARGLGIDCMGMTGKFHTS